MEPVTVVTGALNQLLLDLIDLVPRLLMALIIWYLGVYLLNVGTRLVQKFEIKKTKLDDKAVETLVSVVSVAGRFILILIVLDYLGIGRTIVGAVANGVTFAVAIALGLSFGKALEEDAVSVVKTAKKLLK